MDYLPANWHLSLLAGTTRTTHPYADKGLNLAKHIVCDRLAVEANRKAWLSSLNIPNVKPMWLSQTHSTTVVDVVNYTPSIEADAAISRDAGWMPVVMTADCVPVLLSHADGSEVAAIHAGWKGLLHHIIIKTVKQMHSTADMLYAWIGPCILPTHYEVDDAFRERFLACHAENAAYFHVGRSGHWYADLPALAHRELRAAGLREEHIYHAGVCTYADTGYFSHRRDGALAGRMASFICPYSSHLHLSRN